MLVVEIPTYDLDFFPIYSFLLLFRSFPYFALCG